MKWAVAIAVSVSVTGACSVETGLSGWTMPVPPGTRVVTYEAAPQTATDRIRLLEDLRLGGGEGREAGSFYGPRAVDADAAGNIYVLDAGNHRVQVFDARGRHLRSIGRRGQGPAEFDQPRTLVVAGDVLAVKTRTELSLWKLAGEHREDHRHVDQLSTIVGRRDGTLIADHVPNRAADTATLAVSAFAADGRHLLTYAELPVAPGRGPAPMFAASSDGEVYVTALQEYEVLALGPDSTARWALRVASPRLRPEEVAELGTAELEEEQMPALSHLAVDGHGHLYVYPYRPEHASSPVRPVDVYSAAGERLFSGFVDDVRWVRARGDHVYLLEFDPRSEEITAVRYRLVEPF